MTNWPNDLPPTGNIFEPDLVFPSSSCCSKSFPQSATGQRSPSAPPPPSPDRRYGRFRRFRIFSRNRESSDEKRALNGRLDFARSSKNNLFKLKNSSIEAKNYNTFQNSKSFQYVIRDTRSAIVFHKYKFLLIVIPIEVSSLFLKIQFQILSLKISRLRYFKSY
jgi:hypothetical protein